MSDRAEDLIAGLGAMLRLEQYAIQQLAALVGWKPEWDGSSGNRRNWITGIGYDPKTGRRVVAIQDSEFGEWITLEGAESLLATITALRADNEALRKDAERYRWLRAIHLPKPRASEVKT